MRLLITICSIAFSVLLIELFTGYLNREKNICENINHKPLAESISYSQANFHYKPLNKVKHCNKEWLYTYEIDKDGFRKTNKNKNKNILAIGDSQTFGFGVSDDKSWTNLLGATNAGLWGCPITFQKKSLERSLTIVDPDIVIWNIYPSHIITLMKSGWHDLCPGTKQIQLGSISYFFLKDLRFLNLKNTNTIKFFLKRQSITSVKVEGEKLILGKDCYQTKEKILYVKNLKSYPLSNLTSFNKLITSDYDNALEIFYKNAKEIVELTKNKKLIVWFFPSKTELKMHFEDLEYDKINLNINFLIDKIKSKLIEYGANPKNIFTLRNYMNKNNYLSNYFIDDAHLNEKGNFLVYSTLKKKIN